jgi:hypothetical protein
MIVAERRRSSYRISELRAWYGAQPSGQSPCRRQSAESEFQRLPRSVNPKFASIKRSSHQRICPIDQIGYRRRVPFTAARADRIPRMFSSIAMEASVSAPEARMARTTGMRPAANSWAPRTCAFRPAISATMAADRALVRAAIRLLGFKLPSDTLAGREKGSKRIRGDVSKFTKFTAR